MPVKHVVVLLTAMLLALTACGGDDPATDDGSAIPESKPFNDADVSFATEMIPHHAQALMMVDLAARHRGSQEFTALSEQIRAVQAPEIEQLTDLLEEWDQPVPENPRDHANAGHGDDGDGHDSAMMDPDDLDELRSAHGAEFEEMWLEAMVDHHEEAIEMAEDEVSDGEHAGATRLAQQIADSQQAEVEQMERMLD